MPSKSKRTTGPSSNSSRNGLRKYDSSSLSDADGGANETKSLLWAMLLWGLVFCMMHVFYVIGHLDNLLAPPPSSPSSQPQQPNLRSNVFNEASIAKQGRNYNDNHKAITSSMADISSDLKAGKERILEILAEADVTDLDEETIKLLPTWEEVTALYGDKPKIYGLDQCEAFQSSGDPAEHFASVAGAFNSGTNLMSELLIYNCHMPERMKKYGAQNRGIRWQVPWGKHNPPSEYRGGRQTYKEENYTPDNVIPAVTIKDPYSWMGSMCRHTYGAHWRHFPNHCPNLIPNHVDVKNANSIVINGVEGPDRKTLKFDPSAETVPMRIDYKSTSVHHHSMAHFWNEWYAEYFYADFPRLVVRFEDLVFHAKEVTEAVCKCAGGALNRHGFKYITESAKRGVGQHGAERTGLLSAILKYGNDRARYDGFTKEDLQFAHKTLDRKLVEFFGYRDPPSELME